MSDYKELIDLLRARNDALCKEAADTIEKLSERLEISPDHDYDGIACRDETIRMLEQARADLRESLARAQEEMEGLRSLLREALQYLQDRRLYINELAPRKRNETIQEHADRLSDGIEKNEMLRDLCSAIDAAMGEQK